MNKIISDEEKELYRHIPLHKLVGSTHLNRKVKILCPHHSERTPSCVLFPNGGWKCFGCGSHGNTIDFVMSLGYTFEEAIEELKKYV